VNSSQGSKYCIVIGASAGGIEAIQGLVAGLRPDIPAIISVVVHTAAHTPLVLDRIVERAGSLPCTYAEHEEQLQTGHIYIAPPDRHLFVEDSIARVVYGPKENRHRPSVDSLFRSAALAYRHQAIGVILSGLLDNGTAGLLAIKKMGGIAIVQDPEEAAFASMPESALRWVDVDYCLPVSEIAGQLNELVRKERTTPAGASDVAPDFIRLELDAAAGTSLHRAEAEKLGQMSPFSCPHCKGPLYEIEDVKHKRYRCLVGHAFSLQSLLYSQTEQVETSLWEAVQVMQGTKVLLERMSPDFSAQERDQIKSEIANLDQKLEVVRSVLSEKQGASDDVT